MCPARAAHHPATGSPGRPAGVAVLPAGRFGRGPGPGGSRILAEHGPQRVAPLADPVAEAGFTRSGGQPAPGQDQAAADRGGQQAGEVLVIRGRRGRGAEGQGKLGRGGLGGVLGGYGLAGQVRPPGQGGEG